MASTPRLHAAPSQRRAGGIIRTLRAASKARILGCCLLLWSVVVAPALHLVHHRPDHVHTASGVQRLPSPRERLAARLALPHAHADGVVHVHPGIPSSTRDEAWGQASEPRAPHDGQGAAEHFGLSLLDAPAFLFVPSMGPVALDRSVTPDDQVVEPFIRRALGARAPPASATRSS